MIEAKQSGNNFEVDFFKLMNNSVFGKTLENIRNRVDIRLISSDKIPQKPAAKPNYDYCTIFDENLIAVYVKTTKLYFNKPVYLGMSILDLSKSFMYDFHYYIKMVITHNYSWPTPTLSHMKLRPKIFTKISTPTLRNGLTLMTVRLIIHLELKQDLIVKCLESLRMKLVWSRLLNFLVWGSNFTLTKCSIALKIKNVSEWQRMLQKGVFNSMTTKRPSLAGRNNIEKWMSYEVIVMRFIPKKLINLPSLLTMTNWVIMTDGIQTLAYGHTNLKNCN